MSVIRRQNVSVYLTERSLVGTIDFDFTSIKIHNALVLYKCLINIVQSTSFMSDYNPTTIHNHGSIDI